MDTDDKLRFMAIPIGTIIFMIFVLWITHSYKEAEERELVNHYNEVKYEYTVYLEGQEVDPDTINILRYNVVFDDEHKYVILSKLQTGRRWNGKFYTTYEY